jgi:hypothetical protein
LWVVVVVVVVAVVVVVVVVVGVGVVDLIVCVEISYDFLKPIRLDPPIPPLAAMKVRIVVIARTATLKGERMCRVHACARLCQSALCACACAHR